ncbi:MAG: hypothetical protein Q6373_021685 [Candidatus Sigynarchaeota archaeon]
MSVNAGKSGRGKVIRVGLAVFYNPYEAGGTGAKNVLEDSLAFLDAASFSAVPAPVLVHDIATARQAGQFFKDEGLHIIIVHLATWTGDDLLIEMISWIAFAPVIINWALRDINSGSLCGCQQFNMVLRELKIASEFVLGQDAGALKALEAHVKRHVNNANQAKVPFWYSKDEIINATIEAMRHLRVGIIGARTPGMMEVAFDEFGIKIELGPAIRFIPVAEIESRAMKIPPASVEIAMASFRQRFAGVRICANTAAIDLSVRVYLALKELVKEHHLDAITIDCYPGYMGRACLAFSMLADEGMPCACEADVHAAILIWLVQRFSGQPANHIDTLDVDLEANTITGGHCGSCSLQLARPGSAVIAPVRLANEGACVMFPEKEGPVTLVNLVGRSDTFRACVLTGTAIDTGLVFPGNPTKIKLDVHVNKFLATVASHGLGHHWIVGQGTFYASTIESLFQSLRIKVVSVL